ARKMVREWGMSSRVGPMAWGSQGTVFLGEDLMHTRDYSDETARVIDEEVEHILRQQEERARDALSHNRAGLDAVARALLEQETVDGATVGRLVDEAAGRPTPIRPRPQIPGPGGPEEKVEAQERQRTPAGDGDDDRTLELPDSPRPAWRER
ncbi:MAG: ATP-dependent metalloprotease FtsH, partial [Acidimicrobiales bacterium]|nr:ATP-dependent metalloprotease FtsH [Acidimicrobiales bacterium]